jgi:hypothetical protein
VIGGFSMGVVMSYAAALGARRPSPAALLAFSGFIPTVECWAPALAGREGLAVLIHHGRQDPVISVEFARRGSPAARGRGPRRPLPGDRRGTLPARERRRRGAPADRRGRHPGPGLAGRLNRFTLAPGGRPGPMVAGVGP